LHDHGRAGVTINTSGSLALAQYGGGYLLALSASTFTFFNLGGGATSVAVDYLVVGGGAGGGFATVATVGRAAVALAVFNWHGSWCA
jgi:hypothetical protein